jgi:hypothetical protein
VQAGAITTAIGSQNQAGVAQRSVEQSSAPLASQELVLELVLVLVLVQAASCNLTRAWPTSIPMTPLTVCWCSSSRAGIVAVKDTVDNRITVVVTSRPRDGKPRGSPFLHETEAGMSYWCIGDIPTRIAFRPKLSNAVVRCWLRSSKTSGTIAPLAESDDGCGGDNANSNAGPEFP